MRQNLDLVLVTGAKVDVADAAATVVFAAAVADSNLQTGPIVILSCDTSFFKNS